jgi:hypothetical protein
VLPVPLGGEGESGSVTAAYPLFGFSMIKTQVNLARRAVDQHFSADSGDNAIMPSRTRVRGKYGSAVNGGTS